MEKKIILGYGKIGHADHGSTTLASAIAKVLSEQETGIIISEPKQEPIKFNAPPKLEVPEFIFTPPITRRERRAKERKNKK